MNLTLPDVPITREMGDAQLRLELACALHARGKLTKSGGAELAGVAFFSFQQALAERGISTYTVEDLHREVEAMGRLFLPVTPNGAEADVLVVSDTSVLLNLCRVSAEGLLPELFREVWAPPAVAAEFSRLAVSRPRFQGLSMPVWVRIPPAVQVSAEVRRCPDLDSGETEALSLALELHADAVDEVAGRRAAGILNIPFVGVAGVLLRAKDRGLIPAVRPVLDRLREDAGFWLHPGFEAEVLRLAREEQSRSDG